MAYGAEWVPIASLAFAAAGTSYGVYSGERASDRQKQASRAQAAAQNSAEAAAARQERAAMEEQRKAQAAPDLMSIFDRELRRGAAGAAPTLTGAANGTTGALGSKGALGA